MPTPPAGGLRAVRPADLRSIATTSPEDTYVLAVDLGTGGPKVAVLSATGRIVAHAFESVGIELTDDGGAEQSPDAWWSAIVSSARRALADSGVAPERVVGVGCTSQWSGTVPVDEEGDAIGPAITWMDSRGARAVRETVRGALNVQGYSRLEAGALGAAHGRDPQPVGEGPRGPHPLPACAAPRRLRRDGGVPRAGRLPGPAPHGVGPGVARLHHAALGHRQPGHRRHRLRRRTGRVGRPGADPSCPTSSRPAACWAGCAPARPPSSACWPAPPSSPAPVTSTRPRWARERWPTSTPTSTSGPRAGSAATSLSRRPTR